MAYFNKLFILILSIYKIILENNIGAYITIPDINKLQYRLGINSENDFSLNLTELSKYAGYNGMRKIFKQELLENDDLELEELSFIKKNNESGIYDVIGVLTKPAKIENEKYKPKNLYQPIWLSNNTVNPQNYWADYVYKALTNYKDYIKIWEVWNMPDLTLKMENVKDWIKFSPNSSDLINWNGTIFEYIRLLRITYEVAKKIDPDCWICASSLKHHEFLDGLLRYSDNPNNGEINEIYPSKGGAYFDCVGFSHFPNEKAIDIKTNEIYDKNNSDSFAKKIVTIKKNFQNITKKYGFGVNYKDKIFINSITGLISEENEKIKNYLLKLNWIIKLALLSIEYDIKQIHMIKLFDYEDNSFGYGDYYKHDFILNKTFQYLKDSSKGRRLLRNINLEEYVFDNKRTIDFRNKLEKGIFGIALKRKYHNNKEAKSYNYIYSVWLYCENEEITQNKEVQLDIPFDPLIIDWKGNEKNYTKLTKVQISSTPIFLLGNIDNNQNEEEAENNKEDYKDKNNSNERRGHLKLILILGIIGIMIIIGFIILGIFIYKTKNIKNNINNEIFEENDVNQIIIKEKD